MDKPTQEQIKSALVWVDSEPYPGKHPLILAAALREAQAALSEAENYTAMVVADRNTYADRAEKAEVEVARLREIVNADTISFKKISAHGTGKTVAARTFHGDIVPSKIIKNRYAEIADAALKLREGK